MYQLAVPYVIRTDFEIGGEYRTPDLPEDWKWEQASSRLDTGPLARKGGRVAVVNVRESRAIIEAWMDTVPHVKRAKWTPGLRAVRERADLGALREYRSERARVANVYVKTQEALEVGRRVRSILLPMLALYGMAEVARRLGMPEGAVLGMATTAGTTLIEDGWSGTAGDDVHGRSPDTTDPDAGSAFGSAGGANGMEIVTTGPRAQNNGSNATYREYIWHDGMAAIGDQFSETQLADRNAGRIGVRMSATVHDWTGTYSAYTCRVNSGRMWRVSGAGGATNTQIAIGASNSGVKAIRLEAVGSDISNYIAASGAWVPGSTTLHATANDTTYATGVPGIGSISNGYVYRWRGGSLGGSSFAATIAGTSGAATSFVTATSTPPVFTASVAAATGGSVSSATVTHAPPTFTATISATIGGTASTATATRALPVFTASVAVASGGSSASATATHVVPVFSATLSSTAGGATTTATALYASAIFSASVSATAGGTASNATAASTPPTVTASTAAAIGGAVASGSSTYSPPVFSASVSAITGGTTSAPTATHAAPTFTASVAATIGGTTTAATTTYSAPGSVILFIPEQLGFHALSGVW